MEIGIKGDFDAASFAGINGEMSEVESQTWLWDNRQTVVSLIIRYDRALERNVLWTEDGSLALGYMSREFTKDLWELGKLVAAHQGWTSFFPSGSIKHVRMVGAATSVIPEAQRGALPAPWRHSGMVLRPLIFGFVPVFFNEKR